MGILPLKKCVNRDTRSFATKQRIFNCLRSSLSMSPARRIAHFMPPWLMVFLVVCFLFVHFSFLLLLLSFAFDKLSGLVFELMLILMVMLILKLMMIDFLNLCFSRDIQTANILKSKFEIPWGCKEKRLVSSSHFRLWVCGHQFNILLREAQGWKSLKSNPPLTEGSSFSSLFLSFSEWRSSKNLLKGNYKWKCSQLSIMHFSIMHPYIYS